MHCANSLKIVDWSEISLKLKYEPELKHLHRSNARILRSNIDSFFPDKKVGESSKKLWLQETIARSYPAWYQSPKINISSIVLPPLRTASNYHSSFHNQVMQSTYLCLSGSRKCVLFGKFGILCFLNTPVLRFAPLLCYRK